MIKGSSISRQSIDRQIKELSAFSADALDKQFRHVTFNAFTRISQNTPRDTGRAQASWNVTKNRPNFKVKEESKRGKGEKRGRSFSIQSYKILNLKKDDVVYIANGLDYINILDQGSSKRSGKYFIEKSLREVGLK